MPAKPKTNKTNMPPYNNSSESNFLRKLVWFAGIIAVGLILITMFVVRIKFIDGNYRGVVVGWSKVAPEPLTPGRHFYCPFTTTIYLANIGQQRFVMNNLPMAQEKTARGREKDEQKFISSDNQEMKVSIAVQWHRDPAMVVQQQLTVGLVNDDDYFVETVLRQPVMRETKNQLTGMTAIAAYSGTTHVAAQQAIENTLRNDVELKSKGVVIDTYVVDVNLDPEYTKPIADRQTAIQKKLSWDEQTKAKDAEALTAKAEAQADLNKQVVAAQRDKEVAILRAQQEQQKTILKAEADNKQVVLQAEASKQQVVLAAQGEKEAGQNKADAILAVGKAEAEAAKLKYAAYAAPGAETFAKIEISKSLAQAYSGVKGWIPSNMTVNTFAEDFGKGVGVVVNPGANTAH